MRILTKEECLLVAGGYSSSASSAPGLYMEENYYDENSPEPTPEPPPGLDQDPFFQSLGAHFATNEDARALAELFASATYSVGEVEIVTTGADQSSGPAWGGLGSDFMFAVNMYSAFQSMQNYHAPDSNVMSALDRAGIGYSVTSTGSIYAPGYGYAVANGSSFTATATLDGGSGGQNPYGASNTILVIGHQSQTPLVGVPTFGDDTIVVTGELRQAQSIPALLGDLVKGILEGILGAEIDRWLHQEPDTSRQQMRERLAVMERNVNSMFDPTKPLTQTSLPMRDGSVLSGFTQGNRFFADVNRNGIPDIAFTQNPTTGQFYTNYGNGWVPTGNPFTVPRI